MLLQGAEREAMRRRSVFEKLAELETPVGLDVVEAVSDGQAAAE